MNIFFFISLLFFFLINVKCDTDETNYVFSSFLNFTNAKDPNPRQYHTGIVFSTWNQTEMNNICNNTYCGPFCNKTDLVDCVVPTNTTPIYSNKYLPQNLNNYTYTPTKCSNECCSDSSEYCYRSVNKNGDLLIIPGEEVLLIFGGKITKSKYDPSCNWEFPIIPCGDTWTIQSGFISLNRINGVK